MRLGWEEVFALCTLVAVLVVELAAIHIGLDAQDEGYFVEQAARVLHGDIPYRDFDSLYTPGLLYLHAALFGIFGGPHVVVVRLAGFVFRVALVGGLYALCRPLVRPLFAILPGLFVLIALDRVPQAWEPHPGWPSSAVTVLTILLVSRVSATGRRPQLRWMVLVGALVGVTFAFKQNTGVFLAMTVATLTAWRDVVTRPMRVMQRLLLALVGVAVAWLIHDHAAPVVAVYTLGPIAAAGVVCLREVHIDRSGHSMRMWTLQLAAVAGGFAVVTLPWLAALLSVLNGQLNPLSSFLGAGQSEQDFLWHPLEGPGSGAWATPVGAAAALLLALRLRRNVYLLVGSLVVAAIFVGCGALLTARPNEPVAFSLLLALPRASDGVPVLLPLASIAAGAWLVSVNPDRALTGPLRGLIAAGALTLLAEYPRMDEAHLAWSGCVLLCVGAVVVGHVYTNLAERWSLRRLGSIVACAALLLVPFTSALPNVPARLEGLVVPANDGTWPWRRAPVASISGLAAVDGIEVTGQESDSLVAASIYVRDSTTPTDPIFVYPTSPLMYVMADRSNPTRFSHLYPGAASAAEINQVIASLDRPPVRVVVVSDTDLAFWGPADQNQPLEDYLARRYRQTARFGEYRVLTRTDRG